MFKLVVVVVVVAMAEKGNQIASFDAVLRYHEGAHNENNVYTQLQPDAELPSKEPVLVSLTRTTNDGVMHICDYETKTYTDGTGFTLKTAIINEHDINPGQRIHVEVYEAVQEQTSANGGGTILEDDAGVIDRPPAISAPSNSDGVDSRLTSEAVYDFLDGDKMYLPIKNCRTGNTTEALFKQNNNDHEISFRMQDRRAVDAQPGDLIQISKPTVKENSTEATLEQKVDELHEMVSELHAAYQNGR
jgi:hypothetical protein